MSEDICPVKEIRRKRFPTRRVNLYHDWHWTKIGKDANGATLKRGVCKLCGLTLGIERFCARCGAKLPKEEPSKLYSECIDERVGVIA